MGWWSREFKACSFAVKLRYFHCTIFVHKFLFSYFLYFRNSRKLQLYWKRDSGTGFPCEFCEIWELVYRTTLDDCFLNCCLEQSRKFSWGKKLHIVRPVDIWLGSKRASAQILILKNGMRNLESKAMLKC